MGFINHENSSVSLLEANGEKKKTEKKVPYIVAVINCIYYITDKIASLCLAESRQMSR